MIYTVTFNPSLDYIVTVDEFTVGKTNRTTSELMLPGGKTLQVNESFAWLWEVASRGLFSADSLAKAICEEFDSTPEDAAGQAAQTITLWQQLGVLQS